MAQDTTIDSATDQTGVTLGTQAAIPDSPLAPGPPSAPAAHRNFLQTIGHDIEVGAIDIGKFVGHLPSIIKGWNALAPQVKAVAAQIFHDVLSLEQVVARDIADVKSGDIPGVISLSEETWTSIRQLVADARAGEQEIVDSLRVLGIHV